MKDERTELTKDEGSIKAVHWLDDSGYTVGNNGITKIEAYPEKGESSTVPWVAVHNEHGIVARIPAYFVSVHYDR